MYMCVYICIYDAPSCSVENLSSEMPFGSSSVNMPTERAARLSYVSCVSVHVNSLSLQQTMATYKTKMQNQ